MTFKLNKKQNKTLEYQYNLYEKRYKTLSERLTSTGQGRAIPKKLNINDIKKNVSSKEQYKDIIDFMKKTRINMAGKKDQKSGKYIDVIEGKGGAMITKGEYDEIQKIFNKVNKLKDKAKQKNIEKGLEVDGIDYKALSLDINIQQKNLNKYKDIAYDRRFITDYNNFIIGTRRENLDKAFKSVYTPHGDLLSNLLDKLSDSELDYFLRKSEGYLNFEYIYASVDSDLYDSRLSKILYQLKESVGEDTYNDVVRRNDFDDLLDISVRTNNSDEKKQSEKRAKLLVEGSKNW